MEYENHTSFPPPFSRGLPQTLSEDPLLCYIVFMIHQGNGLGLRMKREEIFQALTQLRKGLFQIIIVIILCGIILFPISKEWLRFLCLTSLKIDLVAFSIPEAFFSLLKLTLYTSLFSSIPVDLLLYLESLLPSLSLERIECGKYRPDHLHPAFLFRCFFLFLYHPAIRRSVSFRISIRPDQTDDLGGEIRFLLHLFHLWVWTDVRTSPDPCLIELPQSGEGSIFDSKSEVCYPSDSDDSRCDHTDPGCF